MRADEKENFKQELGEEKLVGCIVLSFSFIVFFQQLKEQILKLLGLVGIGGEDKRLAAHQPTDGVGREILLQKAVFEVHQKASSAGATGAVKQIDGNPDQVARFDVEKTVFHKVLAFAVENEIKLVGVVIVHSALGCFQGSFFNIKFLGCGINS